MKNKLLFFLALWLAIATPAIAQSGNNALAFDGVDDYIKEPTVNPTSFTLNSSNLSSNRSLSFIHKEHSPFRQTYIHIVVR